MNYLKSRYTPGMIILCSVLLSLFFSCKNSLQLDGPIVVVSGLTDDYWIERSVRIVLSDMDGNILEEEKLDAWVPEVALGEDIADGLKVDLFQVHFVTIRENVGNEDQLGIISFTDVEPGAVIQFPEAETSDAVSGDQTTVSVINDTEELPDYYLSVVNGLSPFFFDRGPRIPAPGEALTANTTVPSGSFSNIFSSIYQYNGTKDYYWLYKENVPSLSTDTLSISSYNRITTPEKLSLNNSASLEASRLKIGGFQGENYYNLYQGYSNLAEPEYYLPGAPFDSYRLFIETDTWDNERLKKKAITRYESSFTSSVNYADDFISDVDVSNDGYSFKNLTNTNGVVGFLSARTEDLYFYWRVISPGKEGRARVILPPFFEHWATEFDWGPGVPMTVHSIKSWQVTGIGSFSEFITYRLSQNGRIRYNNPGHKIETMSIVLQ